MNRKTKIKISHELRATSCESADINLARESENCDCDWRLGLLRRLKYALLPFAFLLLTLTVSAQQQRFPKPEFDSGYTQPSPITPEPRALSLEYFDVLVLLLVLSAATYFALKSRSRQGILWLSIFTLAYFGFYRNGCICSIGSIQNMVLTFFDPTYSISVTTLLFFLLPLLFFYLRCFLGGYFVEAPVRLEPSRIW